MNSSVSLVEFQFQHAALAGRPLKDNKDLLLKVGYYYQETVGSEIDINYVVETEYFLNEIYLKAIKKSTKRELCDAIAEATALASALSYTIKQNKIDKTFFANAKKLGSALISISISIPTRK